jgi:hypothetical protein
MFAQQLKHSEGQGNLNAREQLKMDLRSFTYFSVCLDESISMIYLQLV